MASILFANNNSNQIKDIEKKENKEIERSFISNIYYNWFEDMGDISNGRYSGESKLLNQLYEPYIKGVLDTVPKESQKEVGELLTNVAKAYEKQDIEKQQQEDIYEAKELNKVGIVRSEQMSIDSYKNDEPEEVSTMKTTMHMQLLKENLDAGAITPEMFTSLISDHSKAIIATDLTKTLTDENISTKAKFKEIKNFLNGNTGNDFVDGYMSPLERVQTVSQIMGIASQANAYKERLAKENSEAAKELFENEYMKTIMYIAKSGMRNGEQFKQLQQNLYNYASSYDDIERIANLADVVLPRTTSTFDTLLVNELKSKGNWNEQTYKDWVYSNRLSPSDVVKYGEEFLQPANMNLKLIDDMDALARSRTGFSLSNQTGYNDWKARLLADPEFSSAPIDQQTARAIAQKHLNETMKTQPVWKEANREKVSESLSGSGLNYQDANRYLSKAFDSASTDYNIDNPTFEQIKPYLERDLRENWEFRRKKGIAETITGANGEIITNPELIIKTQSAIIKKNIYDNWENQ